MTRETQGTAQRHTAPWRPPPLASQQGVIVGRFVPSSWVGLPWVAQIVKKFTFNAGNLGLIPESGRFPWRRAWQPTPVFLPAESHGQRSLAGCSPRGHKELDAIA